MKTYKVIVSSWAGVEKVKGTGLTEDEVQDIVKGYKEDPGLSCRDDARVFTTRSRKLLYNVIVVIEEA